MSGEVTKTSVDPDGKSKFAEPEGAELLDPRALLADWANAKDEWVRLLVAEVIATSRPVGESTIEKAYQLFRQEKALDERELPVVPQLSVEARQDEAAPPLTLTRLSEVRGVNALVSGSEIEPHEGLTILYGENGTGLRISFACEENSPTTETSGPQPPGCGPFVYAHAAPNVRARERGGAPIRIERIGGPPRPTA